MPNYSLSTTHYNSIASICRVDIKNNKLIDSKHFYPVSTITTKYIKDINYPNFNIYLKSPIETSDFTPITNISIYSKQELQDPQLTILYSDKNSVYKHDDEIEWLGKKYFSNLGVHIESTKVKSINLDTIFNTIAKSDSSITDLKINLNNIMGFKISFKSKYSYMQNNYFDTISLKLANLVDVKPALIKFINQLQSAIYYNQVDRDIILQKIYNIRQTDYISEYLRTTITDVLNSNKFANLDSDFWDYYDSLDNKEDRLKVYKFQELIEETEITNNKINSKSLNVHGIQFIVKSGILYKLPSIISANLKTYDQIKLCYAVLTYFDKYDNLLSAVSLVKLRTLTSS